MRFVVICFVKLWLLCCMYLICQEKRESWRKREKGSTLLFITVNVLMQALEVGRWFGLVFPIWTVLQCFFHLVVCLEKAFNTKLPLKKEKKMNKPYHIWQRVVDNSPLLWSIFLSVGSYKFNLVRVSLVQILG